MSKLIAYKVGGQPIGTVVTSWSGTDLSGNLPFIIEDTVTSGYEDISSIENWDSFGELATDDCSIIRDEIKIFYDATTFNSLTSNEKEVVSRWFIADKSERDTIKTEKEQEKDAEVLSKCISKKVKDEIVNKIVESDGATSIEITSIYKKSGTIFGSDYSYVSSEVESSTTSYSWQTKLTMTTPDLTGTYRISWFGEITNSNNKSEYWFGVRLNGTSICEIEDKPIDDNHWYPQSGFYVTDFDGVQNIDIVFAEGKNGTAKIRRSRIEIMRIS